jgi:hypothetical protein
MEAVHAAAWQQLHQQQERIVGQVELSDLRAAHPPVAAPLGSTQPEVVAPAV